MALIPIWAPSKGYCGSTTMPPSRSAKHLDLCNDPAEFFDYWARTLPFQCFRHFTGIPERPLFSSTEPLPEAFADLSVVGQNAAGVVQFVCGTNQPHTAGSV